MLVCSRGRRTLTLTLTLTLSRTLTLTRSALAGGARHEEGGDYG